MNENKKIAFNSVIIFIRLVVTSLVGIYISRIVLDALGASDYGIYNVVGGLVTMFSVLTGAMSVATSRFLTFALGVGDREQLRKTFVTAVNIHLLIAALMIVIAEVAGIWFLNNKLNIPASKLALPTAIQLTSPITADVPIVATAVCATVFIALTPAHFSHFPISSVFIVLDLLFI